MKLLLLPFIFFFSLFQPTFAQSPMPKVRHFNADNGYDRSGIIMDVKSDVIGNIWIVHHSGVTRYNGQTFQEINTENVPHGTLLRFYESNSNQPFIIDYRGAIFYIEGDSMRPYEYNELLIKLNVQNGFSDVYFDQRNRLHISFKKSGYAIIENGKVTFPFKEIGNELFGTSCILREGKLPFMLSRFENNGIEDKVAQFYLFDADLQLIDQIEIKKDIYAYPNAITQLNNGNFIYSSGRGNLISFDRNQIFEEIEYEHAVLNVYSDTENGLWISTVENGVKLYRDGKIEHQIPTVYFKNTTSILSAEDYEGGLWVYSEEKGLNLISNHYLKYYNEENGLILSNNVYAFDLMDTKLLAGKEGCKFSRIDIVTNKMDSLNLPIDCERYVYDIQHQKNGGGSWVTQRGKIYYSKKNEWKEVNTSSLQTASNGTIFRLNDYAADSTDYTVGIANRQFFYLKEDSIVYSSPVFPEFIYHVLVQNDTAWVSCIDGYYLVVNDQITNLAVQFPLLTNGVNQSIAFDGKLWLNLRNKGVHFLQNDSLIPLTYNGLQIKGAVLVEKSNEELWVFANQGSFQFTTSDLSNHPSGTFMSVYQPLYGFSSTEVRCNESTVYFGTKNQGILRVEFKDIMDRPLSSPRLVITTLKINDQVITTADSIFELKYNEGFIQISYIGISYKNQKVRYRYRMKELNDNWSYTNEVYIQYTTLPPGKYQFEIQAQLEDQPWSASKTLLFEVSPPYWKTWYFILGSILLIIFIGYELITYRFRIIKREKDLIIDRLMAEQRALRAQMDPHFVFNIVASAQYLILKNENEKANQFLDLFSKLMRSILDQSNQNYQPIKTELKFLEDYIQLECFRLENKFGYRIEASGISAISNDLIPPFFIQPFVENAIHHGLKNKVGKGLLTLTVTREDPFIKVVIQDDGIGREAVSKFKRNDKNGRKSHGIRIIKERLALHHGKAGKAEVVIEDLKSGEEVLGTKVTIYIKRISNESINN
jgi:ligand-binding sensor domain-containing protein